MGALNVKCHLERDLDLSNVKTPCGDLLEASIDKLLMSCHLVTKSLSFTEAKTLSQSHREKAQTLILIPQDHIIRTPHTLIGALKASQKLPTHALHLQWPSLT